jgi:hypothetical protein
MTQPAFDDAVTNRLHAPLPATADFNREDDPPRNAKLRILVEDDWREYSIPWPYEYRAGAAGNLDFFACATGYALHDSLAVRGWLLWDREAH